MGELYINSARRNESIESILKKLIRINENREVSFAVSFLDQAEVLIEPVEADPQAHSTKFRIYAKTDGHLYIRRPTSLGGGILSISQSRKQVIAATEGQTVFQFDFFINNEVLVFMDGNLLSTDDYSIENDTITLNFPAFEHQKLTVKE